MEAARSAAGCRPSLFARSRALRERGDGIPGRAGRQISGQVVVNQRILSRGERTQRQGPVRAERSAQYVVVRRTKWATVPADAMFLPFTKLTIGETADAVVWYGDTEDVVVRPDLRELTAQYGAEFARRNRLMQEAMSLAR